MDSGLARALVGAVLVAGMALAAWEAPAQLTDQSPLGPPPAGPPPADGSPPQPAPANASIAPTSSPPPPRAVTAPDVRTATNATDTATKTPAWAPPPPAKPPPPPPGPPLPSRNPTAVVQVLDKVTAETLQFEAPIGRPIRYKTLVMTVKVCETRGVQDPQPRPSAYVVMETRALAAPGHEPPPAKRVFEGWMFANAPALHPLEHPIYDAWLVSCSSAAAPISRPAAPVAAKPPAAKPPGAPPPVSNAPRQPPTTKAQATKAPVARPPTPPPPAPAPAPAPPPPPPISVPASTPADNSPTPPQ